MMRVAVLATVLLSACASDKLGLAPPASVDFSGQWKLNEADSDDPMHVLQTAGSPAASGNGAGSSGRGGRGGGQGGQGRGGGGGANLPPIVGPAVPTIGILGETLRWPGKRLDVRQVAGVVAFSSEGQSRVCEPGGDRKKAPPKKASSDPDGPLAASRAVLPPICGWLDKTLIVRTHDPDDDRPAFEERYSLSTDGQRLVEVVGFTGGRSSGFMMSRVWDRVSQ